MDVQKLCRVPLAPDTPSRCIHTAADLKGYALCRRPLLFFIGDQWLGQYVKNHRYFVIFYQNLRYFFRPEATLGGVRGSSWHQTPILYDLGGQNGVPVGPPGGTGDATSGIF